MKKFFCLFLFVFISLNLFALSFTPFYTGINFNTNMNSYKKVAFGTQLDFMYSLTENLKTGFEFDGCSNPAIILSIVVFPQPEGPIKTTKELSSITREISLTALFPSSNVFTIRLNLTLAITYHSFLELRFRCCFSSVLCEASIFLYAFVILSFLSCETNDKNIRNNCNHLSYVISLILLCFVI